MTVGLIKRGLKRAWRQPFVWRTLGARTRPRGVAVLTYHRIAEHELFGGLSAAAFEAQMRWIGEFCRPIAASELARTVGEAASSMPPVLVTFDDGYRDFHDVALPILDRHRIPALVFLPTALIGSGQLLWTDRVSWLLANDIRERLVIPSLAGMEFPLTGPRARVLAATRLKAELKIRSDSERLGIIEQLERDCRVQAPPPERQMMTWDEVRACCGSATFGGHTHTHPILSQVEDRQVETEIHRCRDLIEAELGYRPEFFAYPNGRKIDFDERARKALAAAGFKTAFVTEPGWCDGSDWLAVPRVPTQAANLSDFAWLMTHPAGRG